MIEGESASIAYLVQYKGKEFEGVVGIDEMDMIYRVASISKIVTASAAMLLVEKGKLDIEKRVDHYLDFDIINPHFQDKPIRVKHLMNHTSTIKDYYMELYTMNGKGFNDYYTISDIFKRDGRLYDPEKLWLNLAEPGTSSAFSYSNLNTIILGAIVEKISGQRFDQFCRENIFKPLKMTDSTFNILDIEEPEEDCASLYGKYDFEKDSGEIRYSTVERKQRLDENGFYKGKDLSERYAIGEMTAFFGPQGNLHTTLHDLKKLSASLREREGLLKKETIELMETVSWKGFALEGFYRKKGLNLHIFEDHPVKGFTLYGHSGMAYGILSEMYYDPQKELTLIFFINGYRSKITDGFEEMELKVFKVFEELLHRL
jgi:CubicO group peptidase (beta-lactamase class C family)